MKLTNYQRDAIEQRAVEQAFADRQAALTLAEDGLAREAYAFVFPVAEQKIVAKLPEHWLRRDACLRFNVGGQDITLCVAGDGFPVPYRMKGAEHGGYGCQRIGVITAGDLCDRIQAHAAARETIKGERKDAARKVKALVQSVTTIGKLREVWPAGQAFYASLETDAPATVPAIRVEEVNAALGIAA